jgi:hypothetical protein
VSQLIACARHVVMKDPLIEQVYHIVFTENNVECQWVRVLFHDEYKFWADFSLQTVGRAIHI